MERLARYLPGLQRVVAVDAVTGGPVQIYSEGPYVPGKNFHCLKHTATERLSEMSSAQRALNGSVDVVDVSHTEVLHDEQVVRFLIWKQSGNRAGPGSGLGS